MLTDDVFEWLDDQPDWQRDLARRLSQQIELEPDEYSEALQMVKHAHSVPPTREPPDPRPLRREDLAQGADDGPDRLLAIGSLVGVGAVGEHEELSFAGVGLTIVYGQNAAGKSTYVKALKKLCRTVDRDSVIRGNVFEGPQATIPSARIKVESAGQGVREQRTDLVGEDVLRLAGVNVFDSACAVLYVDSHNTLHYLPTELRLLMRLATLQDRMRRDLEAEKQALLAQKPNLISYPPGTAVARALQDLSSPGRATHLSQLATLNADELQRATQLREIVAAADASTANSDAAAAERDAADARTLIQSVVRLRELLTIPRLDEAKTTAGELRRARAAADLAAEKLGQMDTGIGTEPWEIMWQAAREYASLQSRDFPPQAGSTCPLCLQRVDEEVAQRMRHFEEHITSAVQANLAAAAGKWNKARAAFDPQQAQVLLDSPFLVELRVRVPEIASQIDAVTGVILAQLMVVSEDVENAAPLDIDLMAETEPLAEWAKLRAKRAVALQAADDQARLEEMRKELFELDARAQLREQLTELTAWCDTLEQVARLDNVRGALATNRITMVQKELIEQSLGTALEESLSREMSQMECRLPVEVLTSTAKAEPSVGLRLITEDGARVKEIASEGEQRALSLCCFLAELAVTNDASGIIIDDPVSSLDDERHIYIAARLSDEASRRQVIVFTHDLPFMFELRASARKAGVPVHIQHIWRQGGDIGRVDNHHPFKSMNLKERIAKLENEVTEMRRSPPADNDEAWRRADAFYKRLRTSWERAVEERLFQGVVERFERDIKTQSLRHIEITEEQVSMVDAGMTRASRYIHEDTYAAQLPLPSTDDMARDVEALREFSRLVPRRQ